MSMLLCNARLSSPRTFVNWQKVTTRSNTQSGCEVGLKLPRRSDLPPVHPRPLASFSQLQHCLQDDARVIRSHYRLNMDGPTLATLERDLLILRAIRDEILNGVHPLYNAPTLVAPPAPPDQPLPPNYPPPPPPPLPPSPLPSPAVLVPQPVLPPPTPPVPLTRKKKSKKKSKRKRGVPTGANDIAVPPAGDASSPTSTLRSETRGERKDREARQVQQARTAAMLREELERRKLERTNSEAAAIEGKSGDALPHGEEMTSAAAIASEVTSQEPREDTEEGHVHVEPASSIEVIVLDDDDEHVLEPATTTEATVEDSAGLSSQGETDLISYEPTGAFQYRAVPVQEVAPSRPAGQSNSVPVVEKPDLLEAAFAKFPLQTATTTTTANSPSTLPVDGEVPAPSATSPSLSDHSPVHAVSVSVIPPLDEPGPAVAQTLSRSSADDTAIPVQESARPPPPSMNHMADLPTSVIDTLSPKNSFEPALRRAVVGEGAPPPGVGWRGIAAVAARSASAVPHSSDQRLRPGTPPGVPARRARKRTQSSEHHGIEQERRPSASNLLEDHTQKRRRSLSPQHPPATEHQVGDRGPSHDLLARGRSPPDLPSDSYRGEHEHRVPLYSPQPSSVNRPCSPSPPSRQDDSRDGSIPTESPGRIMFPGSPSPSSRAQSHDIQPRSTLPRSGMSPRSHRSDEPARSRDISIGLDGSLARIGASVPPSSPPTIFDRQRLSGPPVPAPYESSSELQSREQSPLNTLIARMKPSTVEMDVKPKATVEADRTSLMKRVGCACDLRLLMPFELGLD